MSEKKVGKRLLTWVLVLVMTLSLLPLNVLAAEVSGEGTDVVYGYDTGSGWLKDENCNGTNPITTVEGVDSVSKTAEPTGNSNEYTVKLEVKMHTTTETQTSYAQAATVLVIDTSGSMSYCLLPEHEHTDNCYISTGVECDGLHPGNPKVYTHILPGYIGDKCIRDEQTREYYKATLGCGMTKHTHSNGCGGDNNRLATAKDAAIDFLESYRKGAGRLVALVSFSDGATEACEWKNVSTNEGYQAIVNAINNLSAGGGTNLDAGLQTANQLFTKTDVQGIGSKNIIALTDGKPTYYMTTDWLGNPSVEGNGQECSPEVFKATANTATSICNGGTTLYSICFGAANEKVKNPDTDAYISLFDYLNYYIAPGKTYSAGDFTGLKNAFDAISNTITSGLSSGTVHDSLPDGVTSDAILNRTVEWDLKDFEKGEEKVGDTTTYTYTKRYTVTIDPTQIPEIQDGDYYPLNGPTTLTVGDGVVIDFPIPAGKVTLPKYTVTYDLDGGNTTSEKTTFPDLTYGVETPTINEPTKAGCTFAGWEPTVAEKVTGNATYKAQWTQDKYTVTYNLDGGNTTSEKTTFPDLTYGVETPTINEPTKAGYTFAGWEPKVAETVTKDVTYKAKWNTNYVPYYPPVPPTVKIEDDDALGLNTTDHFAYIVGYGNGEVRPQNNITRAEVATIFFRLLTDDVRDENLTKTNRYSDVAATSWYNTAVSTLSSMGIITGYPDGTFRPNAAITRAEFAAIAARFDNDGDKTAAKFSDIATHWAKDEISIAYNNGWITGYPDGTFGPQRDITRAETMTLVNRVLNRQPETEDDLLPNMTVWTDNANPKAWYYLAVQEATNSHYYKFKTNSKYEKWTELRETRDWTQLEK